MLYGGGGRKTGQAAERPTFSINAITTYSASYGDCYLIFDAYKSSRHGIFEAGDSSASSGMFLWNLHLPGGRSPHHIRVVPVKSALRADVQDVLRQRLHLKVRG